MTASATTTTITGDSPDPSSIGAGYTVSVQVSSPNGTPSGSVIISDGVGGNCNALLTSGIGSCNLTSATPGQLTLTASYPQTGAFAASSDTELHLVGVATTTSITSDAPDPSAVGASYSVNVQVTSANGTPGGSVAISDGAGANCNAVLSGGTGSCSLSSATPGQRTITASYPQTGVFAPSSDTENHVIGTATTTTITDDSPDPSAVGASYSVSVQVTSSGATPTGNAIVSDGAGESCIAPLSNGSGSCTLASFNAGLRTLTASYPGTAGFAPSNDSELHTVGSAAIFANGFE
jgi:uncharacterized lipoprotein YmbA